MALPTTGYATATVPNPSAALTDFTLVVDLALLPASWWAEVDTSDGTRGRAAKDSDETELACDWIAFDDTAETGVLRIKWSGTLATSGTQVVRIYPPKAANAAVAVGATYGQHAAYDGDWLAYWPLEEAAAGTTDEIKDRIGTNHGTGVSAPSQVAGQVGEGLSFDGVNDYVEVPADVTLSPSAGITLMAWFNRQGSPGVSWGRIVHKANSSTSDDWALGIDNSEKPYLRVRKSTGAVKTMAHSTALDTLSGWHHLAGTWDDGADDQLRLYLDYADQWADGTYSTGVLNDAGEAVGIGGHVGHIDRRANGYVDDVQVHGVRRAAAWIEQEYDQTSDPATYWGTWSWTVGGGGTSYDLDVDATEQAQAGAAAATVLDASCGVDATEQGQASSTAGVDLVAIATVVGTAAEQRSGSAVTNVTAVLAVDDTTEGQASASAAVTIAAYVATSTRQAQAAASAALVMSWTLSVDGSVQAQASATANVSTAAVGVPASRTYCAAAEERDAAAATENRQATA